MNQDNLLSLALLGWFIALAIVETLIARKSSPPASPNPDARFVTNFGLTAILFMVGGALPLANVAAAASAQGLRIGLADHAHIPWAGIVMLTLLGQTFGAYWLHRWFHRNPWLWRIHRVHHADSAVDVSTSFRNHPFELLLTVPMAVVVTLTIGAPISAVSVSQTIIVAATIWEHADISLPPRLDKALSAIILTPRLHRLHHNPDPAIHDTNYGTFLSFWDRLFGTLCVIEGRGRVGLDGQVKRPDHFLDQIRSPLLSI
jgi:sterol desaturase/sphingolipid hydroxylase (fatty acid hydroxylase superfamily)